MAKKIPLTRGMFALVDKGDYRALIKYKWHAQRGWGSQFYAANSDRKRMHRIIMAAKDGELIDHINHDGLDNRRINLRKCDKSNNEGNSLKRPVYGGKATLSRFKGVSLDKRDGKWSASAMCKGKRLRKGGFYTEEEAAKCYNKFAMQLFGEFARLNDV